MKLTLEWRYNRLRDRLEVLEVLKRDNKKYEKEYCYLLEYKNTLEFYINKNKAKKRKNISWLVRSNIIDDLLKNQKGKCFYCKIEIINSNYYNEDDYKCVATIDHFYPIHRGGEDNITNFVASCNVCNKFKSNIIPKISIEKAKEIFKNGNSTMENFIDF